MATPRHAWQRSRPPWHASQRPRHACNVLGLLGCFPQGPRSPTSKIKPPTCFLISCEAKGVVYHQASIYENLVVHYSLGFTAYKEASRGFYLRCGTPRTLREPCRGGRGRCQGMPRTLQSMPRRPRTLPSKPRSCQASLHILGSHTYSYFKYIILIINRTSFSSN